MRAVQSFPSGLTVWLAAGCLVACTKTPQEPPPPPTHRSIDLSALGVGFEIPHGWSSTQSDGAFIVSGPEGSDAFYTTITLQAAEASSDDLQAAHKASYSDQGATDVSFLRHEITTFGGLPALRYDVSFELHEQPRRKTGILIDRKSHLLDIAYGSTADLFDSEIEVFERILATLELRPPDANNGNVVLADP